MNKYLPNLEKISQETIATFIAVIVSAWVISKIPALRDMVRQNSTSTL